MIITIAFQIFVTRVGYYSTNSHRSMYSCTLLLVGYMNVASTACNFRHVLSVMNSALCCLLLSVIIPVTVFMVLPSWHTHC